MKQEMMGCQWQQLEHMLVICTLAPNITRQHLIARFFTCRIFLDAQPVVSKHQRQRNRIKIMELEHH